MAMADASTQADLSQLLEQIAALSTAIGKLASRFPTVDSIVQKGACQNVLTSFFNVPAVGQSIQIANGSPRRFGINLTVQTGADTVIVSTAMADAFLFWMQPGEDKYMHFDKYGALTQVPLYAHCLVSSTLISVTEVLLNC